MESLIFPWLAALLTIIVTISLSFTFLLRKTNQNIELPPESEGGWPLIGHLTLLSGPEHTYKTLSDMADKYGPLFSLRLGSYRTMVISNWEVAKECFTSDDHVFADRQLTVSLQHMCYDFATFGFGRSGPYWREMRKISIQKLLSSNKVASFEKLRANVVRSQIRSLYISSTKNAPVEMKKWFADLNMNLMVRIIAGDKQMDLAEKWHEPIHSFFKMMGAITVADVLPKLRWLDYFGGVHKDSKVTGRDLDALLQTWLDFHKKYSKSELDEEECFMAQMMKVAAKVSKDFSSFDADTITKATCQTMMLGGTDSMTIILIWALCLLLNNRHTLKKAQDELDRNVGRERQVNESDLESLVYIQSIIKETLRLYPTGPVGGPRVASEDCTLAGYHVPAGTRVMVNVWKVNRDPKVWSNPLEFQPERFIENGNELELRGFQSKLMTFGQGRRECPGISFARPNMVLAFGSLLHGFDIETRTDEPVDMSSSFGTTNMKTKPLEVILKPRLSPMLYE